MSTHPRPGWTLQNLALCLLGAVLACAAGGVASASGLNASNGSAGSSRSSAGAAPALEDAQLKAAFVYRFAQFTQWPPPPLREFTYCIAGNIGMQDAMQTLTQKGYGAVTARLRVLTDPQQAIQCQLLMLGFSDRAELQRWQAAVAAEPVLVVGESAEAFRSGAAIALVAEPNGLAFRVNHTEAKRRGLVLSSQMLKLAREVK